MLTSFSHSYLSEIPMGFDMKKKALICDIDMCFLKTIETDDLDLFYSKIHEYDVNEWCLDMLHALSHKYTIIFITARGEKYRLATKLDLDMLCDFKYKLFMRNYGDLRPDYLCKRDVLLSLLDMYDVTLALDDNLANCKMFQSYGIPTLHVLT